jgi:hypothetical protein
VTATDGGDCGSEERELTGWPVSSESVLGGSRDPGAEDGGAKPGGSDEEESEPGGSEEGGSELGGSDLGGLELGGLEEGWELGGSEPFDFDDDGEDGGFEDDPDGGSTQPVAAPVGGETHDGGVREPGTVGVLTPMTGVGLTGGRVGRSWWTPAPGLRAIQWWAEWGS